MASSSASSTPPPSNDLPRLPLEIWIRVFEDLESLENLQSLTSASPIALYFFQGCKRYILRPLVDNINSRLNSYIIAFLLSSFKVRKLLRNTAGLTRTQIENELSTFLIPLYRPGTTNPFQYWNQNLSAVIKLTNSFRKISSAVLFYRGFRDSMWLKECRPSVQTSTRPEISIPELKKFFFAFMDHTIRLDLFIYNKDTLLNPRASDLDPVAWQSANPNFDDVDPKLWQPSSSHAGGLAINTRGLVRVAGDVASILRPSSEDTKGEYTHMNPLKNKLPYFVTEELRLK